MPVPDHVIFGPGDSDTELTYLDVRGLQGDDRFHALKRRLDKWLLLQISELAEQPDGSRKVYAPLPLFLLTCIAIETTGMALFRPSGSVTRESAQKGGFLAVCAKLDGTLSRPLSLLQKRDYDSLWGTDAHKDAKSYSEIIFRLGRHTIVHGYRGKGVYLSETEAGRWQFEDGSITLNPYWFWSEFRRVYDDEWNELFRNTEATSVQRSSATHYLNEILN